MNVAAERPVRPSDALAAAFVVGTFALAVAVYDAVPAEMVVHYTPPGGVYYGPETLPKPVALFIVPAVTALTFGLVRALPSVGGVDDALGDARPYYHAAVLLLVALLSVVHVGLVLWNLA